MLRKQHFMDLIYGIIYIKYDYLLTGQKTAHISHKNADIGGLPGCKYIMYGTYVSLC